MGASRSRLFLGGIVAIGVGRVALACVDDLPSFAAGPDGGTNTVVSFTSAVTVWRPADVLTLKISVQRSEVTGAIKVVLPAGQSSVDAAHVEIPPGLSEGSIDLRMTAEGLTSPLPIDGTIDLAFDVTAEGLPASKTTLTIRRAGRPGDVDRSFGVNGFAHLENGTVRDILAGDDGTVLVAGGVIGFDNLIRPRVVRLTTDGKPDPRFSFAEPSQLDKTRPTQVVSLLAQPPKFIAAFVEDAVPGGATGILSGIMRLDEQGALDTGFGDQGVSLVSAVPDEQRTLRKISLAPDGLIVGAGSWVNPQGKRIASLRWWSTKGVPVTTAGTAFANPAPLGQSTESEARTLIAEDAGALFAGAQGGPFLSRYHYIGGPDGGPPGYAEAIPLSGTSTGVFDEIVAGPNGQIFAGGDQGSADAGLLLRVVTQPNTTSEVLDSRIFVGGLALDPGDRLVVAGRANGVGFALARFRADGGADTFNSLPADRAMNGAWRCVSIQNDGKILAGGEIVSTIGAPTGERVVGRFWD